MAANQNFATNLVKKSHGPVLVMNSEGVKQRPPRFQKPVTLTKTHVLNQTNYNPLSEGTISVLAGMHLCILSNRIVLCHQSITTIDKE